MSTSKNSNSNNNSNNDLRILPILVAFSIKIFQANTKKESANSLSRYQDTKIPTLKTGYPSIYDTNPQNRLNPIHLFNDPNVSFERIHTINKRATPIKMSMYKLAIQLFKLYNSENQTPDWIDLNIQQNFNGRSTKFLVSNCAKYKIGMNLLVNRFSALNNTIELNWLNLSLNSFKIKCKAMILT